MGTANYVVSIVEDEANIGDSVAGALTREGFRVRCLADGSEAWASFEASLPDLVILDILLPGLDGLELCRRLRRISRLVPIIFLTSRDEEIDRVVGLELGADDYLCKPFSLRELVARVKVLFRRLELTRLEGEAGYHGEGNRPGGGAVFEVRLPAG